MQEVLPVTRELALFDTAQTRLLEHRAAALLPAHALMRRAGESAARLALAIAPHARRIWIAAGPGNNGGDGLEAAIHLQGWGKEVRLALIGDPSAMPADARAALARARAVGVHVGTLTTASADSPQLAIDALLGIGGNRAPDAAIATAVRTLNALACPVLAVDLPSGLRADTGQPFGTDCVVATHTLTMLTLKPGLFTGAGRDHVGAVWLDTLGVDAAAEIPHAWLSGLDPVADPLPRRHAQHKGSFGDVAVVGGSSGMRGAAILAARAAHAAGAGRVYVELLEPDGDTSEGDPMRPELMFRRDWSHGSHELLAHSTVVCGCGGADAVRGPLPRLISLAGRLVLDADALNVVANDTSLAALLRARGGRGLATVMTPHPLEAARLLGTTTHDVQANRVQAAREMAECFACVIVLKGSGSVIAAPGQTPRVNSTGNAALATAGTGDVLAGWIAGRWAPLDSGESAAFAIACRAVAEHGAAANSASRGPLRAADLVERLYAPSA